jgi:two-component system chemotaxis sensor kinase CheA
VSPAELEEVLAQQKPLGELMVSNEKIAPEQLDCALAEQAMVRSEQPARSQNASATNVKVPAARLDTLMDLVGELVIAQARLNQCSNRLFDADLLAVAESIERLTTELRENSLSLRMLPIGTTFGRFRRLVRDLAGELGKEIELITEGAETELDKTIIDRLADPMVHLIRNAIDHGIEMPEDRQASGKLSGGTVKLSATHSDSHVIIKIQDDGKGLDSQAIRARGIERGLISEDDVLTDTEIFDLVFEPGFSTAKTISNISGRGVGMDVVKRAIQDLRGIVYIESTPGQGSTIHIEIPLTLAIIEGLLVGVAQERYVLLLSLVEECIELPRQAARRSTNKRTVEVRGELVPFVRLSEWFELEDTQSDIEQVVLAKVGDHRFGFVVDEVIGQHQTVIKGLGKIYEGVQGISGATILGDGPVALIIDVAKLIDALRQENLGIDQTDTMVSSVA